MRLRLLTLLLIAGLPLAAHADDAGLTPADGSAAGLTAPANAGSLGPSTTGTLGPATNGGDASSPSGGSSADSGTLQPAGTSPLQSTTNDSNGLTAPTGGNPLQAPAAANQQLQVIMGDGDGPQHNVADTSTSALSVVWWSFGIGALVAALLLLWRRLRRRSRTRAHRIPDLDELPAHDPAEASASEPTSSQRLNVTINKPAHDIFEFVLDPKNTPKWVSFIKSETTNEWPPKLGTIYTNSDETGEELQFELTQFKPDEMFVLSKKSNSYHVRYSLTELDDHETELEYYEWMDEGNLAQPFTSEELQALKRVMEEPGEKATNHDQPKEKSHKHAGAHSRQ